MSRRVTFPLRSPATTARLVVEDAQFEIYRSTDEARDYLMNNIAWIMQHFGAAHDIVREDVILASPRVVTNAVTADAGRSLARSPPHTTPCWSAPTRSTRHSRSTSRERICVCQGCLGARGRSTASRET